MEWLGSGSTSSTLLFAGVAGGLVAIVTDAVSAMPLSVALAGLDGMLPEVGLLDCCSAETLLG